MYPWNYIPPKTTPPQNYISPGTMYPSELRTPLKLCTPQNYVPPRTSYPPELRTPHPPGTMCPLELRTPTPQNYVPPWNYIPPQTTYPLELRTPLQNYVPPNPPELRTPPPRTTSGRYASYWNAFLYQKFWGEETIFINLCITVQNIDKSFKFGRI